MRIVPAAIMMALVLPASAFAADAGISQFAKLAPPVEQCIRDNAAKVEKAVGDLSRAVDFLVSDVCAVPVAIEQERQMKEEADRSAAKQKARCEALVANAKTGNSGDANEYPDTSCSDELFDYSGFSTIYVTSATNSGMQPPAAAALAARLLLDLRLSNPKKAN